jgi:hypothetical protein
MPATPVDVVQRQLDAYNRRDLDAFCATFHPAARIFDLGAEAPSVDGIDAIRARYADLFARSPMLHSVVLTRTTLGRAVVDLERITGRNGSADAVDLLAIYEVRDGLIARGHFVWP